jgi:hypothetical protein
MIIIRKGVVAVVQVLLELPQPPVCLVLEGMVLQVLF